MVFCIRKGASVKQYKKENYIKNGLSLGIFLTKNTHVTATHTHDFVEIVYIVSGEGIETINDVSHHVRRGDMLFINYNSTHKVEPTENFSYINICFLPEIVGERIITGENAFDLLSLTAIDEFRHEYGADIISFAGEERRFIETVLFDMIAEYSGEEPERRAVLESYMNILIAKILRKRKIKSQSEKRDDMWQELATYIEKNLDKKITLNDLAKKCFYNPSYFSRIFKERYGATLVDHITKERVRVASKLLRESGLSAERIAEKCGFGDRTSLYRAFTKAYGVSPAEYRKSANK